MLGTDTITIFKKRADGLFNRFVVYGGVQWSDKDEVVDSSGRVNVTKYASVTFFGTFDMLDLTNFSSEDAMFYGAIDEMVVDGKISTLLKKYPKSGLIKSVKDNSNRDYLKNIKVVLV